VRRPDRSSVGWNDLVLFARYAGLGVAASVAGTVVAYQLGTATPPWIIGTVCLAGGLLLGGGAVVASAYRPQPAHLRAPSIRSRTDREAGGLQRVERTLERGFAEVERFNLRVRPWLVDLAGQRLRRHDPTGHRELLGGSLCQLIEKPLTVPPTRKQLAEWIARIEAL
jgi:hypothetical protein